MAVYDNFSQTFAKSRDAMKWPEMQEYLATLSGTESILDLGCGSGRFAQQYFEQFGKYPENYLGIDQSVAMIEEACYRYKDLRFEAGDMSELKFLTERFDRIVCFASFHHLPSLDLRISALTQMKELLHSDGHIFMTNWALSEGKQRERYMDCQILESKNEFGAIDYSIKIGDFDRLYHNFTDEEIRYIATNSGLQLDFHRLHESERNYITQLGKKDGAS